MRFLTPSEMQQLTGRSRAALQCAVLRSQGIAFVVNAAGKPVVTWDAVNGRAEQAQPAPWTPRALRVA